MNFEREAGRTSLEEQYRKLLAGLSGVLSAKVTLDEMDDIREIHVLASADRNVKQVVRDVRSALSSFFDIDVDHRIISVAQMKDDGGAIPRTGKGDPAPDNVQPFAGVISSYPEGQMGVQVYPAEPQRPAPHPAGHEESGTRLKCGRISQSLEDDSYAVTVTLKSGNQAYDGSCSSRNTEPQRMACIANAVINAVHNFLGRDTLFRVVSVTRITNLPVPVCMVLVEFSGDTNTQMLVGATEIGADKAVSIERATLDAINRKLLTLCASNA